MSSLLPFYAFYYLRQSGSQVIDSIKLPLKWFKAGAADDDFGGHRKYFDRIETQIGGWSQRVSDSYPGSFMHCFANGLSSVT